MTCRLAFLVLVLALPVFADDKKEEKKPDELTGTWTGLSVETGDGKDDLPSAWTFKGGKLTMALTMDQDKKVEVTYKIDATKDPKQLDITGADKKVRRAIYKIEKDTLTICQLRLKATDDEKRPDGFDATKRKDVVVRTFRKKND